MATPLIRQKILTAQTTLNVAALIPDSLSGQFVEFTLYVKFSTGAAAGAVVIETAWDQADPDTWANIGTVSWAAEKKTHYVSVTGVFSALRVRISSAVTSGTIDAWFLASAKN